MRRPETRSACSRRAPPSRTLRPAPARFSPGWPRLHTQAPASKHISVHMHVQPSREAPTTPHMHMSANHILPYFMHCYAEHLLSPFTLRAPAKIHTHVDACSPVTGRLTGRPCRIQPHPAYCATCPQNAASHYETVLQAGSGALCAPLLLRLQVLSQQRRRRLLSEEGGSVHGCAVAPAHGTGAGRPWGCPPHPGAAPPACPSAACAASMAGGPHTAGASARVRRRVCKQGVSSAAGTSSTVSPECMLRSLSYSQL